MPTTTSDYYEVLGVDRTAGPEEIQRAYRRLARRFHPDVSREPGTEERFKQINEAYGVLSDPAQRARYDRYGDRWRQAPEGFRDPGPFGRFATTGGSPGPGGFAGFGVDDMLGGLFGGGFRSGPVAEAEIEVSVEEACAGGRRRITLPTVAGPSAYEVVIPPGVTDGTRLRAGHLWLVARLAPHPRYRVDGRDLTVDVPVMPWDAALGASVPVETPSGPLRVQIPPGSSSGRRLRVRGRGIPHPTDPGDLYAELRITVPAAATDEERRLWQRLAAIRR